MAQSLEIVQLVSESTDSNKKKWSGHSEKKGADDINMISSTTTTDKTYKISSKKMRKMWERIDAPNNDERMYMTTISSRNRTKNDFLARMIVFTIIIGKALTKEIGGSLSENDILKENHHGQFTGIEDREDLSRIDDQVIGARRLNAKHRDLSQPSPRVQD